MRRDVSQKGIAGLTVALEFNVKDFGHSLCFSAISLCVTGKLDGDFHKGAARLPRVKRVARLNCDSETIA